jgi:DNA-directed RNA polymerase I and III subunit RPAC1
MRTSPQTFVFLSPSLSFLHDLTLQTSTIIDPDVFASVGVDNSLNIEKFKEALRIVPVSLDSKRFEFDLIGCDPVIANTLRRIILSEVPTLAIDRVVIRNNTSVIPDEVLAHRIGLVPLNADPAEFEFRQDGDSTPYNTVIYRLKVGPFPMNPAAGPGQHVRVMSADLAWVPIGDQKERFVDTGRPLRPLYEDIVLAKLAPGQEIDAELYAEKGVGRDHAKWQPAATAWYRQLPVVSTVGRRSGEAKPITGATAQRLKTLCPMRVFDIEDGVLAAPGARQCSLCRACVQECTRLHEAAGDAADADEATVRLESLKRHQIFVVEAESALAPERIVRDALTVLANKCDSVIAVLDELTGGEAALKSALGDEEAEAESSSEADAEMAGADAEPVAAPAKRRAGDDEESSSVV